MAHDLETGFLETRMQLRGFVAVQHLGALTPPQQSYFEAMVKYLQTSEDTCHSHRTDLPLQSKISRSPEAEGRAVPIPSIGRPTPYSPLYCKKKGTDVTQYQHDGKYFRIVSAASAPP